MSTVGFFATLAFAIAVVVYVLATIAGGLADIVNGAL
jgi:hypothetical protein